MKILHIITSLLYGGAEKLVAEITPLLSEKGYEVDVLAFNGQEPNFSKLLTEKGINVYTFGPKTNVYNPLFIFKLSRMMKNYDIIHTHNTSPQLFAAIGSYFNKCKLVTTEHNTFNRRRNIPILKNVDRWMYSRYQSVICISDQAKTNLCEYLPDIKGVCTIYNGVDVHKFHEAKAIEGMHPEGKQVIAMVAAFRPQKDQDTLIRAMAHLDKDAYELWIVGDGERRYELESLVDALDLRECIKFLGLRTDIPEILKTADLVVMSSHYEGLSLSNIEGMSVGKPFIASDVDGLHEMTEGAGLLFPHGDDKALADLIRQLHDNLQLYQQVADACYEKACQFDISKMVEKYNEVYKELGLNNK